jgi:GTPase SAR1 family protein
MWDALSPPGVAEGNLDRLLSADTLPLPPEKLSQRIIDYPGHKNRNPASTEMQILGGIFLEDLAREPVLEEKFLEDTYCKSGALSQYALVSKDLLRSRYSQFFESEAKASASPAVGKKGVSPEVLSAIGAAAISRRPILLVGDVGVGKSIFIRRLIKIDAREELSKAIVLYIDFGSKPSLASDLKSYVSDEIERQLREDIHVDVNEANFVRGVYNVRIDQFAKSTKGELRKIDPESYLRSELDFLIELVSNKEEHLKQSLGHISKGQKRQIVLFLDNVDQRPIDFQEQVFIISQTMASEWPLTAFLALRPETFFESKVRGFIAAYQPRVFTIDPPRIDRVLVKRLSFALDSLNENGIVGSLPFGVELSSSSLCDYMEMLKEAIEKGGEIVEMIDNMCAGNVRAALAFLTSFVGSGHVDSKKILKVIERGETYHLPFHEFFRAVILGDGEHYNPANSPFINIFDISTDSPGEHFLLPALISFVERQGQIGGSEGYVEKDQVYAAMSEAGFHPNQVRSALARATDKGLMTTPVRLRGDSTSRLRISPAGAYMIKKIAGLFAYIDVVVVDVPITAIDDRIRIRDARTLEDRIDRAELFLNYLNKCWIKSASRLGRIYDWAPHAETCKADIARVKAMRQARLASSGR